MFACGLSLTVALQIDPTQPFLFKERLDHFHFGKEFAEFFSQRYYVNDNWYQEGSDTIILRIGSESELKTAPGGDNLINDIYGKIAEEHNGLILALEHRFYGESQPFHYEDGTIDITTERLRYLTSEESIADLIYFTEKMDEQYCAGKRVPGKLNCKWVIIGGSYPGALAGWIMQQHANVYTVGIASSGVVEAVFSLPEFDQETYKAAGHPCGAAYRIAMREIEEAMENGDSWPARFLDIADYRVDDFYYFLADTSLMVFEYGNWTQMCAENLNPIYRENGNVTKAFLSYIKRNYDYRQYDEDDLKTNMNGHFREWWYQTCTEVAYFEPAPLYNNIRSEIVDLDYHCYVCHSVFHLPEDCGFAQNSVERTNNYYGGLNLHANDTFFSNFWQDVWHDCGLLEPTKHAQNVRYVKCKDCGHCIDLHLDNVEDKEVVKLLRREELDFVNNRLANWRA